MSDRIALYVNPVAAPWSFADEDSWGGGEEDIVCLARALARAGLDVTVFWQGPAGLDGSPSAGPTVTYLPYAAAAEAGTFAVAIYRKTPEALGQVRAERALLWTDQAERPFDAAPYAAVVVASPFLARCLEALLPRVAPLLRIIPDGIDLAAFPDPRPARDPALVVHASSPDRGLVTLLDCWPAVLRARPTARLKIAYGWELFLACGGDPALKARVEAQLAALPPGSAQMARLSRRAVHALFCEAGLWAYWCTGGEYFCQTAVKAQAAGAVPVVRPWGALHDTVQAGRCAETPEAFVEALIELLDPAAQEAARAEVLALPPPLDWDAVAARWLALLADLPGPLARPAPLVTVAPVPALCPPPGASVLGALQQLLDPWLKAVAPARLWVHPSARGVLQGSAATPAEATASVVGFALEEAPVGTTLAEAWTALGIPPGQPVAALASAGPWRADTRTRLLEPRDFEALLGPETACAAGVVDPYGSALTVATGRAPQVPSHGRPHRGPVVPPRDTLSVCLIVRDAAPVLRRALDSVRPHADELIVIDTGSTDTTAALLEDFARAHRELPLVVAPGTSPRWCYDCGCEHAVGELRPGHRFAGFETPRNESLARARGDWVLWLDADEELLEAVPGALGKYLRPNAFVGYSVPQHHFQTDSPGATKVDLPVRLFRREADGTTPGLVPLGPHRWPTYHPGTTVRFAGIVHEHPGAAPEYTEGLGPVAVLGDVLIAHGGYYTEWRRRGRFIRNWPLMVADRQKYPNRRLGIFLAIRDYAQHARYLYEAAGQRVTPEVAQCAEEVCTAFETHFLDRVDGFLPDALGYYAACAALLGRGPEFQAEVVLRWPEVFGPETVQVKLAGRCRGFDDVLRLLEGHRGQFSVFDAPHR